MRSVRLDNSDLLAYLDTIEKLKEQPSMQEYREEYFRLREDDSEPQYKLKEYYSAHTELRRLDRKRQSLIDNFIIELNPISSSTARTAAKSSGNLDVMHERMIYQRAISGKSDEKIVALVIKQRTEAALEFQRSVEQSLEQLLSISSDFDASNTKRKKMAV